MSTHCRIIYRLVPEFPGYRVGNDGSVWSRWARAGNGTYQLSDSWKQLKPRVLKNRRHQIRFCFDGKRKEYYIHRLVLLLFIGPPPSAKHETCHKDDDPSNNKVGNLYWGTRKQNAQDAIRNGKMTRGASKNQSNLTDEKVMEIRRLYKEGKHTQKQIGKMFGVDNLSISNIVTRRMWTHI